ncbi:MAG: hypothetical protein K8S13_24010, partial [Desulfobacula sp.]|uniref:right-handed parallel beta-helix repeat-containing protein n=1 Tax=Desulfobacula sp. TaxID=2593537 RepID=UPI0025BCF326
MISVLCLLNLAALSYAETISGILTEDETWSGIVNITGDITVPEDITLTIEPGTQIILSAQSDDTAGGQDSNLSEFIINGSLVAEGTDGNPILFSSNAVAKTKGDWGGIYASWELGSKTLSLVHCEIEYTTTGVYFESSVGIHAVDIRSCDIRHTTVDGIFINSNTGAKIDLDISGNEIFDADRYGIYCYANGSNTQIDGSISGN